VERLVVTLAVLATGCAALDDAREGWRIEREARAAEARLAGVALPEVPADGWPTPDPGRVRVVISGGALRVDEAGARRRWRAAGFGGLPAPITKNVGPPPAGSLLSPALYDALHTAVEVEALLPGPESDPPLELWAEADAPWDLLLTAAYSSYQAGFPRIGFAVSEPTGARIVIPDPPPLCYARSDAPEPEPCLLPHVRVGRGGLTLRVEEQAMRRRSPPPTPTSSDDTRLAELAALLDADSDCMYLSVATDDSSPPAPARPLAASDLGEALSAIPGICPALLLSAEDAVPWAEVAPVLAALRARGQVWLSVAPP